MSILSKIVLWFAKRNAIQRHVGKAIALAILFNFIFGLAFYLVEHDVQQGLTMSDAIWWAMVTMTTVGYGDYYAQTTLGRYFISYPCMLVGIGIIGFLVGTLAESMLERVSKRKRGLVQIKDKNHILICNCPGIEKIIQLVNELRAHPKYKSRTFILVTDAFQELPDELKTIKIKFVKGNPCREDILMMANITACEGVFVLANNPSKPESDAQTFAVGAIIEMIEKETGRAIKVVVELISKTNLKMMRRADTDGIVSQEGITDCLLVQEFLYPGIYEIFQQLISNAVGSQFYIVNTKLYGYIVSDIQVAVLEHPENLQVIGIIKNGRYILNPPKTMCIEEEDKLIVLADKISDFKTIEDDLLIKKKNEYLNNS